MAPRRPAALPIIFRPDLPLRIVMGAAGIVSGVGSAGSLALYFREQDTLRLVGAIVLAAPCGLAAAFIRRCIVVDTDGLRVTGLLRTRTIPWAAVLAIEQTRRSFVIITEHGDVSAGSIAAERRDLLFRKVLELAGLTLDPVEPRWGIVARFVRRTQSNVVLAAELRRDKRPRDNPET